jgi:hypothetical protein
MLVFTRKTILSAGYSTTATIKGRLTPVLLVTDIQILPEGTGAVVKPCFLRTTQQRLLTRDAARSSQSSVIPRLTSDHANEFFG